jgi:hypothetical protein
LYHAAISHILVVEVFMTIEQTIDIPEAARHLTVPPAKPDPTPGVHKLHVVKLFPDRKPTMTPQEALDKLSGMLVGSKFTVDALLEERRRDLEREKE